MRSRDSEQERRGRERRRRWSSAPRSVKAPTAIPEGQPLPRVALRERRYRRALVVADAVAASFALLVSWLAAGLALSPVHLLVPLAAVLALEAGDLYDRDDLVLRRSTLDEAPSLLQFAGLATIAAAVIGGQRARALRARRALADHGPGARLRARRRPRRRPPAGSPASAAS